MAKALAHMLCLSLALLQIGCGGSSNVKIAADFPALLTQPRDLKAAVVLGSEFSSFVATPNKNVTIDIGSGQKAVWENSFAGLISDVTFVESIDLIGGPKDLVVVPSVRDVQVSVPSENYLSVYEVWIKYNIDIIADDGSKIDQWFMPVYGKTSLSAFGKDKAIRSAAETALRDVGAKLSLDFFRIPAIQRYLDNRIPEDNP